MIVTILNISFLSLKVWIERYKRSVDPVPFYPFKPKTEVKFLPDIYQDRIILLFSGFNKPDTAMKGIFLISFLIAVLFKPASAQYSTLNAHSHNDYENVVPFRTAYDNHFGSIEADIWAVDGDLFVAHNRGDIRKERTLDALYLEPAVKLFRQNGGKAWADNTATFQLLIDIKTPVEPALSILIDKLLKNQEVFRPDKNKNSIHIVITGNRPDLSDFQTYPDFILFDGILDSLYTSGELDRVALFSENIRKFTSWNGEGKINPEDSIRLMKVINSVHALNKKIRFWNAPDDVNAWNTFTRMGIDFINTDHIEKLAGYFNNY
jgi:alkaline phosphatase